MKKLLAIGLIIMIALTFSVTVFADPGAFITSPSYNGAPILVDNQNPDDCEAIITITSYANRHTLPDDVRLMLEQAYSDIASGTDLTKLNSKLAELAEQLGISVQDLAVSELFDISYSNCDHHGGHDIDMTIQPITLGNFVALLHYNGTEWELIENAKVDENGFHLTFSIDNFSPFAIVVNTGDAPALVEEEGNDLWVHAVIIGTSSLAMGITAFKNRNKLFFSA